MAKDAEIFGPDAAEMWEDEGEPVSTLLSSIGLSNHHVILSGAAESSSLDERVDQSAQTAATDVPTRDLKLEQQPAQGQ